MQLKYGYIDTIKINKYRTRYNNNQINFIVFRSKSKRMYEQTCLK